MNKSAKELRVCHLTSKQVQGSSGGQVHAGGTCPRRHVGVSLTHPPPLSCSTVIMQAQLAAVTHKAWVTQTALSFLRQNTYSNNSLRQQYVFLRSWTTDLFDSYSWKDG